MKTIRNITTIIICFIGVSAFAQNESEIYTRIQKLFDEKNYTEAIKIAREYAEKGVSDVQYWLGDRYYMGIGISENYKEAVKWYRKAAKQGNLYAQSALKPFLEKKRIAKEKAQKRKEKEEATRMFLERRRKKVEAISEGDKICYSEDWKHRENRGFFFADRIDHFKMKAVLLVEKVLPNGKVKLIVNNVYSSNDKYYGAIKIGNVSINRSDVIYFTKKELVINLGFQFCD